MKAFIHHLTLVVSTAVILAIVVAACNATSDADEPESTDFRAISQAATAIPLDALIGMEGVTVQPLARGGFPDQIDGGFTIRLNGGSATTEADVSNLADAVSAELTFEPEGFVGWHTHPGPAIVTVVSGALTIVNEIDCVPRIYAEGQAFVDPGQGNIHVAYNDSGEDTRVYAIFLDVPPGDGPTSLLDEPGNCPA